MMQIPLVKKLHLLPNTSHNIATAVTYRRLKWAKYVTGWGKESTKNPGSRFNGYILSGRGKESQVSKV
jgi:hypothetical protein